MKIIKENKKCIGEVITALNNGAVLVLPTDTVYGLVCDAENKNAVEKVFRIKKRDESKPLPIFIKDIRAAKELAEVNEAQEKFLKEVWPGAVTVILKAKDKKLSPLTYKGNTIGLRVPECELLNLILEKFGKPLAQTSANISGEYATTKIKEIIKYFENKEIEPDLILDAGDLKENKPSKVVDLTGKGSRVLRA